jgi:hypothetical protein
MGQPILGSVGRSGGCAAVRSPLEMDEETFRDLGHRLVDTLAASLDRLPRDPVYRPLPAEVRQELEKMDIPVKGATAEGVGGRRGHSTGKTSPGSGTWTSSSWCRS